jgi:hypothetical protein
MTDKPDGFCPKCGQPELLSSQFCGSCGQAINQTTQSQTVDVGPTANAKSSSKVAWIIGGVLLLTAGLVVAGGVYALNGSSADADEASEYETAGQNNSKSAPNKKKGKNKKRTVMNKRLKNAKEVDRSADYSYVESPPTCSAHAHITDIAKEIGSEIDKELRKSNDISIEEEEEFGEEALKELPRILEGRLVKSGNTVNYLRKVAAPLVAQTDRKEITYRFYIMEDTEVSNAMALPGGHIIFTRPFYDEMIENEAQLAMVLGHEIGHIEKRHPTAIIQYSRTLGLDEEDEFTRVAVMIAQTPYSSILEEECDRYAAKVMYVADYSVFQAVKMWELDASESESETDDDDNLLGAILGTVVEEIENVLVSHPKSDRRACFLKQYAAEEHANNPKKLVYIGRTNRRKERAMSQKIW